MANNSPEVTPQVGEAWGEHFKGQNDAALTLFEGIIASAPDHIDANFGRALCLKAAGKQPAAIEAFEKTKKLAQTQIGKDEDTDVRNRMIVRLVDQHLVMLH